MGTLAFKHKVDGSFVTRNGQVVGSSLIGQNFADKDGNPLPQYFQPRPSDAGAGYDPTSSARLQPRPRRSPPGRLHPRLQHASTSTAASLQEPTPSPPPPTPTASPRTPRPATSVISPTAGEQFAKNKDGTYVCDPNTVPERAIAYRGSTASPPTPRSRSTPSPPSYSGLDPDISPANADLQAPRVAEARHLRLATVRALITAHTNGRQLGFLGEETVNVLDLNLALDKLG